MKTYCIKEGYKSRSWVAPVVNSLSDSWQDEVYRYARELCESRRFKTVLDIGCGSGEKLNRFFPDMETLGTELKEKIPRIQKMYPQKKWEESDFGKSMPHYDIVICADVIEHFLDPDELLDYIDSRLQFHACVMSTPERDAVRGVNAMGPPKNRCHAREWNQKELHDYIGFRFDIFDHFRVNSTSYDESQKCQVIVFGKMSDES